MEDDNKTKFEGRSTKVYLENVMKKVFPESKEDHLKKLFSGDLDTLDKCAQYIAKHLDYRQLLHTLCLVTGTRFDLEFDNPVKAADRWLTWYELYKDKLVWDKEYERWNRPK